MATSVYIHEYILNSKHPMPECADMNEHTVLFDREPVQQRIIIYIQRNNER